MKYEKINILERYKVPAEVKFCKRCTISNQRPRITFDEEGICSACRFNEKKRQHALVELLAAAKRLRGALPAAG